MTHAATICHACGAKFRATRARCPRCRAALSARPSGPRQVSALPARIAVVVLAMAAVSSAVILWTGRAQPAAAAATVKAKDPLGGRRRAEAAPVVPKPTGDVPADPAFVPSPKINSASSSEDAASALAAFHAQIAENPSNHAALTGAGNALIRLGRRRDALPPLKQAMRLQPEDWASAFSYGYSAALEGDLPEAVAALREARRLMPEDGITRFDLGAALARNRDFAGAIEEYTRAIELGSEPDAARLGVAVALDRSGKSRDAASAYRDCLGRMAPGRDADVIRARLARLEQ